MKFNSGIGKEMSAEGRVHQIKDGDLVVVEIQHEFMSVTVGFFEWYADRKN